MWATIIIDTSSGINAQILRIVLVGQLIAGQYIGDSYGLLLSKAGRTVSVR